MAGVACSKRRAGVVVRRPRSVVGTLEVALRDSAAVADKN
jgi:hypothetical protein